ncbi:MAG: hypothetical protein HC803_01845 [Saprospiraceae bacterium]|nr:hypothetical protein [Saprospiraceae bacterium]
MKILKVLLTAILVVGFIMPGCNNDSGCDCSGIKKYFNIEGLDVATGEQVGVDASAGIQWQDFRGKIAYEKTYYGDLQLNNFENKFYGLSLIPTASACSCAPDGYKGGEEGIDSLTITTIYDYNVNFPAGTNLAAITEVSFEGDNYEMLQEFLVRNKDAVFEQQHIYRFLQAPDADNTPFQVKIRMVLNNGEIHEATTEEIVMTL